MSVLSPLDDLLVKWERERRERGRVCERSDGGDHVDPDQALERLRAEPDDDQPRWRGQAD
jgi:hypothetical protein